MFNRVYKEFDQLIKSTDYAAAFKLAAAYGMLEDDSVESSVRIADVSLSLYKLKHGRIDLLENAIERSDKILSQELQNCADKDHKPFLKVFKIVTKVYNEAAIHHRYLCNGEPNEEKRTLFRSNSEAFSKKALKALDEATDLISEQKSNLENLIQDDRTGINALKHKNMMKTLVIEEMQVNGLQIDTAFAKNSPKLALHFLSSRRDNIEFDDVIQDKGVDTKYFLLYNKANAVLHNFDLCDAVMQKLHDRCNEIGIEAPSGLVHSMKKEVEFQKVKFNKMMGKDAENQQDEPPKVEQPKSDEHAPQNDITISTKPKVQSLKAYIKRFS